MKSGQIFLLGSGIMIILTGVLFALIGLRKMQQGKRIMNCPPVEATITEYKGARKDVDRDDHRVSTNHVYRISYRINGKDFEKIIQCHRKKYEVGDELPVRYDPKSPIGHIYFDKSTVKGILISNYSGMNEVPTGTGWFVGAVLCVIFGFFWMINAF